MNNNAQKHDIYFGLVHYPTVNKRGETVTTSVTNLDVHDLARVCTTFYFHGFIITPLEEQKKLLNRIVNYWNGSAASDYNPDRVSALQSITLIDSIEDSIAFITKQHDGIKPKLVITSAINNNQNNPKLITCKSLIEKTNNQYPLFVLFGTGWGLHQSVIDSADYILPPILGRHPLKYNHLSVRAAFSIYANELTRN